MADKDTREDYGTLGEAPPFEGVRSEGGPATREPEVRSDDVPPRSAVSEEPAADSVMAAVETEGPVDVRDAADQVDGVGDAEPWRSAIADALAEPPDAVAQAVDAASSPEQPSFTSAAEDLFSPAAIAVEPHLITIGRRLDPSLRGPRPVAPVIEPRPDSAAGAEPWWKTTPWPQHLRTAARYGAYALGGYLALVLVLILLFRFVNPPGSMLMLTQLLTGTAIDRTWVPLESISRNLVRAVVVSEDGRFCEHSGIDTAAIREAIDRAARGTPRGASTISMQVTKNLFLWNAKSYVRKVIEIPLTLFMELIWPKRRILEVYLNIAEWGPGVFGAEAAARHHFGKSAARIGEREAALLAAVLPNPVVRDAGAPSQRTSAKARVVQSRVKAYGAVASCVAASAAAPPPTAAPAADRPARTIRKPSPRPARKKQAADPWDPVLNFGSP